MNSNRIRNLQFHIVSDEHRKHPSADLKLPKRATTGSAAYDFFSPIDIEVPAFGKAMLWTDIKAQIPQGIMLMIDVRSSMGKYGIRLANTIGIIDSDFYNNPSNDGNIGIFLENTTETPFHIRTGERVAQGMFVQYFVTRDDDTTDQRTGGFGSTTK